ncbi:phage major tail 2 family protein [Ehrlichia chaffeensis str. Heartland]|uniref:Uncharacterized protein n=1 Tax=Ehrlichia chaffeensis (strain ATCC CRL-10679 / Arkansas) TaxID=205920 RepID=Q2GGG3_EHRCR|nr:phage tail tube protein [Ehrlichia chaffeensis]ABD44788.1 conserved hypothetical protein [Ehrlichia chaffeensis str. Arkansas]AHX03741.1 phage major tail 2 family protein [Ehrlichia chaffeensis str. Heartland]AHX05538.1 phage major tail 2 family protein [Ehrlichia chaffeensis str. Jax]AHX06528.1 phage major tail 2 family protein [Ehrlichia chaffeensis str. Liberty]AHX07783.1 phage major tail 2 family protein [Ehrlichia chaffeensis str. Osceola]
MSIELQIKDSNNSFSSLNNIKSLRISLHNKNEYIKNISLSGWKTALENSGNRYVIFKVQGIIDYSSANQLLQQYSFNNDIIDLKIIINKKEVISAKCIIELYERYYESSNFDNFNMVLISYKKVIFNNY